jgi:hypothetical protein
MLNHPPSRLIDPLITVQSIVHTLRVSVLHEILSVEPFKQALIVSGCICVDVLRNGYCYF